MATTPSNVNRFQTSLPVSRIESGTLVTNVTPHRLAPIPIRPYASRSANLIPMPKEPEDALLTGGTRSLDRRLLGLNVQGSLPVRKASERIVPTPHTAVA